MQTTPLPSPMMEQLRTQQPTNSDAQLPFSATTEGVDSWLQSLPILNIDIVTDKLELASNAILSSQLDSFQKYLLVEQLTPNLYIFFDESIKSILDAKFPLRNKLNELTEKLLSIFDSFSGTYISIIKSDDFFAESTDKKGRVKPLFDDQQKALILHRALSMLGLMQIFSSLTYRDSAIKNWGEVNALFNIAQELSLSEDQTEINNQSQYISSNIVDEYIKINYLHLALLNRFRQRDILKIHRLVTKHSPEISISNEKTEFSSFFIDLNTFSDILAISKYTEHLPSIRFFENEALVKHIATLTIEKNSEIPLETNIIQKLLPCWQQSHSRQYARNVDTKKVLIYPGFNNIINKLSPNDTPSVLQGEKSAPVKRNSFGLSDVDIVPIENGALQHESIRSEKDFVRTIKKSRDKFISSSDIWSKPAKNANTDNGNKLEATQQDASASGFLFNVSPESKPLLQAADLIGIEEEGSSIELAIIRRLNNLQNDGVSLGVELIAPSIKLAVICNTDKSIRSREVIFIPGIERIQQPDAIISISKLENPRISLELKINDQIETFNITKLIETNSIFTHYTLQKVSKEG